MKMLYSLTLYGWIFRLQRKTFLPCFFEILTHPMWGKNAIFFNLPPFVKPAAILYEKVHYLISTIIPCLITIYSLFLF